MNEQEVEQTLREIREQVRATFEPRAPHAAQTVGDATASSSSSSSSIAGASGSGRSPLADAVSRIEANLATTERAWNRLPPVMSNRSGWTARLELWVKRKIKRATHWFTWEQVNFNAAVHHSLRDALAAISACAQQLTDVRAELAVLRHASEQLKTELAEARAEAARDAARTAALEARLASETEQVRRDFDATLAQLRAGWQAESQQLVSQLASQLGGERQALVARLELVEAFKNEQHERLAHLLDEQRVCFKQLSLEATEEAAANDRARRTLQMRFDELARRLEAIEEAATRETERTNASDER